MKADPRTEALRAHLDRALAGEPLHPQVLAALISSWEMMRRALADAPPPQLAVDVPDLPYGIWHAQSRGPALSAVADRVTLETIDGQPRRPEPPAAEDRDRRSDADVVRELVGSYEAVHGPIRPRTGRRR